MITEIKIKLRANLLAITYRLRDSNNERNILSTSESLKSINKIVSKILRNEKKFKKFKKNVKTN